LLTGTLNVGSVRDGALQWARDNIAIQSDRFTRILPVVAETFDGRLHDAWNYAFDPQLAAEAITAAKGGFVAEGAVGGGTGMISFGFKGGIGTSSRLVAFGEKQYTVGALAQCNFGFREALTILGAPVGRAIGDLQPVGVELDDAAHSSLIVVIATDAPFDAISLKRIARRAVLGMGRLGGAGEATSGDIFLAFSTAARIKLDGIQPNVISSVPPASFDPFAIASVDAVEEAIINALFAGTTMDGNDGSRVYALPPERAATIIRQWHA
jgi:L-aminopeptidase/D-esterase-like protein